MNNQRIDHFIGGELAAPASGQYLDNVDPATGAVYSTVAAGDERDVERAVDAAKMAFPEWSHTPAEERSRFLLDIATAIEERLEEFALAESIDTGKPLTVARTVDIARAIKNFRFFATAVLHQQSESHTTDHTALNYTLRRPRGVAGLISPWNLPLYLFSWKVAPALATGNTVVGKPSEITPMTAHMLAQVSKDVGLPAGVFNVVHGLGPKVGTAIVEHPEVKTISFTGGTATGAEIAKRAGPAFKKVALELGGKNPTVVFADANLEEALQTTVRSAFSNQGQICLCGSRIFVEKPIYEQFVETFVAAVKNLRIGDPLEASTDQGALTSAAHRDKVLRYIDLAIEEGGTVRCGGRVPEGINKRCTGGFFVEPTVVTDLPPQCRVNQEEIFGPVVTVTPFETEDDVIAYANGTPYGLSASVWTNNLKRAHRVAEQIESGTVWINCWMLRDLRVPFGGMKDSGVGREGGEEALRFFTEPKNVCLAF